VTETSVILALVVVTALGFDFTNGFHDTANAMATSIATKALQPKTAVLLSGILNLVGAFLSVQVALTVTNAVVKIQNSNGTPKASLLAHGGSALLLIVLAGLVGGIVWNLLTWLLGLPSSSSHALFGGLIGAVWMAAGTGAVRFDTVLHKIVIPAVTSPVLAAIFALSLTWVVYRLVRRARRGTVERGFRLGQVGSASLVSLAHGTSDAQKTMGVITLVLISAGSLPEGSAPPLWVIASAGLALALGTYAGGWRIIRTLGRGLTDLEPPQGFAAETSSATIILGASHLGLPLSTTQVCAGGILGSGLARGRFAGVRWSVARRMALAWLVTLPAAGIVGGLSGKLATTGDVGVALVVAGAAAAMGTMYWLARRNPVTPENVNELPQPAPLPPAPAPVPVAA
jgi:PiT family inorganic phosphate transporter